MNNSGGKNNAISSVLLAKPNFPISSKLRIGDSLKTASQEIGVSFQYSNSNYTIGCDFSTLNLNFKNGKIATAQWQTYID